MSTTMNAVYMPKWGLAMTEGILTDWHVADGDTISVGDDLCDIETTKITNVMESPVAGSVLRLVAEPGATIEVGSLIAVVGEAGASSSDIDDFVEENGSGGDADGDNVIGPQFETVSVEGRKIGVSRQGETGPTVLFVHGFGGDSNGWMFNQGDVSSFARTVAIDLPGHGASTTDVGDGTAQTLAKAVIGVIDELDLSPVHLVGHSLGGAVSVLAAGKVPSKVASLTLLAPGGFGTEVNQDYIDGFLIAERRKDMEPVLALLLHDKNLLNRRMVNDTLKQKRRDGITDAQAKIATACFNSGKQKGSVRDILQSLMMPVRVLWGRDDGIIPVDHVNGLPDTVEVTILDGCGHLAMMEQAGAVNDAIRKAVS